MTPNMVMVMGTRAQRLRASRTNVNPRWGLAAAPRPPLAGAVPGEPIPPEPARPWLPAPPGTRPPVPGIPKPMEPIPEPFAPPMGRRAPQPPPLKGGLTVRRRNRGRSMAKALSAAVPRAGRKPGPQLAKGPCPPGTQLVKEKTVNPKTGEVHWDWVCKMCNQRMGCISWLAYPSK
jgi:hypothetical protein